MFFKYGHLNLNFWIKALQIRNRSSYMIKRDFSRGFLKSVQSKCKMHYHTSISYCLAFNHDTPLIETSHHAGFLRYFQKPGIFMFIPVCLLYNTGGQGSGVKIRPVWAVIRNINARIKYV